MQEYILPNMCAFYIASGYRLNAIWETNFNSLIGTVMDMLTDSFTINNNLKSNIKKILKIKYNLKVINETPLILDEALKIKE